MTILQIEYFVEIVKSGSFTKAAEKLFVTHQALSLQIQALEKELGMPLFDRSNKRKLVLLENGEILYKAWEPMLEANKTAIQEAKHAFEEQGRTLRVGVQDTPKIRDMSIRVISEYIKKNNLRPEFFVSDPGTLISKLDAGEIDMCSVISYALVGKEYLMQEEIGDKKAVPVIMISKEHPLAKKKKLTITDLKDEVFITFDENYARGAKGRLEERLKKAGIEKYKLRVLKNIQEVKMAVCMNQGVAIELDLAMADILNKVKLYQLDGLTENDFARVVMVWKDPKWNNVTRK